MKRRNFFTAGMLLGAGALAKPAGAFAGETAAKYSAAGNLKITKIEVTDCSLKPGKKSWRLFS